MLSLRGFPPAPHHLVYGEVRDQLGNPLQVTNATVTFASQGGVKWACAVTPGMAPAKNYHLELPMDSGLTPDAYKPDALLPTVPFKLSVTIGKQTYFPMEMTGDFAQLGLPGKKTHLDLTLGVDANHDGLPDAWELAMAQSLGLRGGLSAINPNAMVPGTGLTFAQIYVVGTYNYAPKAGFVIRMVSLAGLNPVLEFTAVKGRSYSLQGSSDLKQWAPLNFQVLGSTNGFSPFFQATTTRKLQVNVQGLTNASDAQVFKLLVE